MAGRRVTLVGRDPAVADEITAHHTHSAVLGAQKLLVNISAATIAGPSFRPYAADDRIGVEVAGSLKNVYALACGAVEGAELVATRARQVVVTVAPVFGGARAAAGRQRHRRERQRGREPHHGLLAAWYSGITLGSSAVRSAVRVLLEGCVLMKLEEFPCPSAAIFFHRLIAAFGS